MNDIEKLNQVINTLEKQSSRVTEFNGVLSAVNTAREQIETAKALLAKAADEQKNVASVNVKHFDDYKARLSKLETLITSAIDIQNKTLKQISSLPVLTPEQYELGLIATEKVINEHFSELSEKIDASSVSHKSAIKSLRIIVVLGLIILAGGMAFFAKKSFM